MRGIYGRFEASEANSSTGAPGRVVIVGAGPAGLTAAYQLVHRGAAPLVVEKAALVGGIARTEQYKGYRFDIGGHRFFTKVPEVQKLWHEALGDGFVKTPRLSRIYYRERFYKYPLNLINTLINLGIIESFLILLSYFRWQVRPHGEEDTFEQWVVNRFGRRLFRTFFKTYTEKVWGIPCDQIRSDWAAQRIKGLSLKSAVWNALTGRGETKSLIKTFDYPKFGPGMMWERFAKVVEDRGGEVRMETDVVKIHRDGMRVRSVELRKGPQSEEVAADHLISSMPITELVAKLDPPAPDHVREAADHLSYRDFIIVTLVVRRPKLFPDNWIYIHSPGVSVGRIQNFKNWSAAMVPDPGTSCVGMEYFCSVGDQLWAMTDAELIAQARRELASLKLANIADIEEGTVIRQEKAYPVYDADYAKHVATLRQWLAGFVNLQTIGRNGMHRYNNQDHSMLTAMLAVENIFGATHNLWDVNVERSYHEEFRVKEAAPSKAEPARQADVAEALK